MKRLVKKFGKSKKPSLTVTDALGSSPEPATSTTITSTAFPMLSVPASAATTNFPIIQAAGVNVSVRLSLSGR